MDMDSPIFRVDELYSSSEIQQLLNVGNAGGVRVSVSSSDAVNRVVVMTSALTNKQARENPYQDRIEGDILVYTGAGLSGDQLLSGVNKRLPQQLTLKFPIYGFEITTNRRDKTVGPKRWKFLGLLEYLRHYPSIQLDARGEMRRVWLFEFRIHREPHAILVENELVISIQVLDAAQRAEHADSADRDVVIESYISDDSATQREQAVLVEAVRKQLLSVSPQSFEHVIKELLIRGGFERVEVTKYSQDSGIDVNGFAGKQMWPIENLMIQIQAKRWLHSVGRREVAELRGSLQPYACGAVVTTSHFSRAALAEAHEAGKKPITLIDGYQLASIVRAMNLEVD